jgi:three-Cys-motif partner protein
MAAPKTTIWDLEPHTRAKHEILKRYLYAWIPILSQGGFPHVLYMDGFAGPGRYSKGELGSPLIALRCALEQRVTLNAELSFVFIERDPDRARVLAEIISEMNVPSNFHPQILNDTFESAFANVLGGQHGRMPPTFAFIDPFGWTGAPFAVVTDVLSHQSCEVLVTFMYEEINRFIGHPDQEANFDTFFGTSKWRDGITLVDPRARNRFLHNLYLEQLRNRARANYVRSFEMRNANDVTDYFLFYATNNLVGLKRMKEAMWKVDESGEFTFSDATIEGQMVLFEKKPRYDVLREQVLRRFRGKEATVGEIETFVLAETPFRETHYKRQVLKPLELATPPLLKPQNPAGDRRPGTYADPNLRLRFR